LYNTKFGHAIMNKKAMTIPFGDQRRQR